ncbi:hypothetical protein LLEC1_03044 [Akanthomyces lecanii]|uniref:Major facilitator superfamily (MFS) profile domain-containing protein n=1 Tax=Cordyceps confragosa TaxID=2714763 RepID=A0A179IC16_CORDF|nr:hypothetical protein LLEC1_03044 [Akanthomyces lecanii]
MSANASTEHGYGTVQRGDVEDGKPFSDDAVRQVDDNGATSQSSSVHVQDGVRRVEAITSVWSKNTMAVMFILRRASAWKCLRPQNSIYGVGHIGAQHVVQVVYADMTTLRNRMLLFGLLQLPTVAATFGGPRIADLFRTHASFRWAFGAFCVIVPVFAAPVVVVFFCSKRKAQREGKFPERVKTRSYWESVKHYAVEFDVVGMFLTIFGWSLLLLPFSLVQYAPHGWRTGYIIAMIVVGIVLLTGFVVWERFFATVQYFPFKHLKDRSVLGACLVYGFMFLSIFTWDTYYYSYLQVVHDLSITNASYVLIAFSLMSSIIGPLTGVLIRYHGYYKWPSIGMTPFAALGTALLVYFRTPSSHVGYLVMCQLFNGIYSGVWAITAQLAIMANITHQETAVALALYGLFGSIGAAIGQAIAGGIWTNTLPQELYKNLPAELKSNATEIYADITLQLSYPMGSSARDAIILSYGRVQRIFVIVGCSFLPLCILCLFLWRNINVRDMELTERRKKGNVL